MCYENQGYNEYAIDLVICGLWSMYIILEAKILIKVRRKAI